MDLKLILYNIKVIATKLNQLFFSSLGYQNFGLILQYLSKFSNLLMLELTPIQHITYTIKKVIKILYVGMLNKVKLLKF